KKLERTFKLGLVGKYMSLKESYKSLNEAILHAGIENDCQVDIIYIDPEEIEARKKSGEDVSSLFNGIQALIVPGGFGARGSEGKILTIQVAREKRIPFLGICLGMQLACIEVARNLCGIKGAHSQEFNEDSKDAVIHYLAGQSSTIQK